MDYLEESRLEDTIDAVSCSIQQQDMDALYHVKYEDEGNDFEFRFLIEQNMNVMRIVVFYQRMLLVRMIYHYIRNMLDYKIVY